MIMQKLDKTIYIGGNGEDDSGPSTPDRRPGEGNDRRPGEGNDD